MRTLNFILKLGIFLTYGGILAYAFMIIGLNFLLIFVVLLTIQPLWEIMK